MSQRSVKAYHRRVLEYRVTGLTAAYESAVGRGCDPSNNKTLQKTWREIQALTYAIALMKGQQE